MDHIEFILLAIKILKYLVPLFAINKLIELNTTPYN